MLGCAADELVIEWLARSPADPDAKHVVYDGEGGNEEQCKECIVEDCSRLQCNT